MAEIKSITNPEKWERKQRKETKKNLKKFNSDGFNTAQKKEILEIFGDMIDENLEKIKQIKQQSERRKNYKTR